MKINYIIISAVIPDLVGTPALAQKKLPPGLQKMPKKVNLFLQDGRKNLPRSKFLTKKFTNSAK